VAESRNFLNAPPQASTFVANFLEPLLTIGVFLLAIVAWDAPFAREEKVLCVLVLALTFPGVIRFQDDGIKSAVDILMSWATLLAILVLCGYATDSLRLFDERVLVTWAVATPVLLWSVARFGRHLMRQIEQDPSQHLRALVVGAGPLGARCAEALAKRRGGQRTQLVGHVDDRVDERLADSARERLVGGLADVGALVRREGVHEVYITLPLSSQPRITRLLEDLQDTTASVYLVPDVFGARIIQGRLQDLHGVPVVGLLETPFTGANQLVKRISDIVLASLILVLISPILAAVALGVKLSSPGPVIFRQKRNGLNGEEITVYKFRSMRTQDNGPVIQQAQRGDPRITPFGAFIRKTSLDELPQFINVLQGRMSIVGPRPHAVAHNEQYRRLVSAYMVRHKVKPGITGWAQVNGLRGETDTLDKMAARVQYDLDYLRHWSLALDLQIIARTVKLMVFDRHAY
jgi:putative colanic acid biosynthesis UDP-glucose lipid carrier transferase